MLNFPILAIDIGSQNIKSILVDNIDNIPQIIGSRIDKSAGVKNSIVIDMSKLTESIINAVNSLQILTNTEIKEAHISISSLDLDIINTRLVTNINSGHIGKSIINNILEESKKSKIQDFKGKALLHTISNFVIDKNIKTKNPHNMHGKELVAFSSFLLSPLTNYKNIKNAVNSAGLRVQDTYLNALADTIAITTEEERETGIGIINMGAETTTLSVFIENNIVFNKVFPIGGKSIDKDIAKILGLNLKKAENIKMNYKNILPHDLEEIAQSKDLTEYAVSEIIEARLEMIFFNILKDIKELSISKTSILDLMSKIFISGGSSSLANIDEICSRIFNKKVEKRLPIIQSSFSKTISNPVFSTSIGILDMLTSKNNIYKLEYTENILNKASRWYKELF